MRINTFHAVTGMAGAMLGVLAGGMQVLAGAATVNPANAPHYPPAGTAPAGPPATSTDDGYRLVWHDEFDRDGPLNPADWGYENGFVRNQEAQFYQPENALCKDGFLILEARRESKPNPRYAGRSAASRGPGRGGDGWPNRPTIEITSASVNTRGKHEWTYGRFEIRAKIDVRSGSWPAFWTLGVSGGWPGNGEVDILEYYRDMVLANVAWQGPGGAVWNSVRTPLKNLPADWATKFHTWRMDWDEKAIQLFLDDVRVNEQDLRKTVNTGGRGAGTNPFIDKQVYILLNQAIGGQSGGDYSGTEFPVHFYVDYVRVWQKGSATKPEG
jgi:beta-glucanase (GH16 family)